jgi:two-component system sensor histidine kinase ChvG
MSNDLKKRIREIEEFASDVSHELKNPLAGLKSSSDLLKTKKVDESNRDLLIKNMGKDIDRMNILISDISNYTLTQVEMSEEGLEQIELVNFLENFKNSISHNYYSLDIQNIEKIIYLKINKNKFSQVIHNLLDNALSYVKKNSKILICVKLVEKNCIIHFVDQGPGILLDYKDKIFERFYTDRDIDRSLHSGLGLSISKKIIEGFGGNINLIKSPHFGFDGACFEIKLPLKDL